MCGERAAFTRCIRRSRCDVPDPVPDTVCKTFHLNHTHSEVGINVSFSRDTKTEVQRLEETCLKSPSQQATSDSRSVLSDSLRPHGRRPPASSFPGIFQARALEGAPNPHPNSRIPLQLEKIHVVPPSSQDEALSRYSVSGEVPR